MADCEVKLSAMTYLLAPSGWTAKESIYDILKDIGFETADELVEKQGS